MHNEQPLLHALASQHRFGAAICCVFVLALPSNAYAGLCGDSSGDGFVTASDALATLRLAVTSGYDRRGDVMPRPSVAKSEGGDGDITAVDALETLRAAVEARIPACHGAVATRAAVSTAADDFSSAGLAIVDISTRTFEYRPGAAWRDSVIRAPNGIPIVVNRNGFPYGNTLKFFDIEDDDLPTIKECSISDGFDSNPQDVLLLSGEKGYVTAYAGAELLVISPPILFQPALDPACRGIIVDRIDLSAFDSDGVPQMDQMLAVGDDLFVSLQLLDDDAGFAPKQNGVLAVIDTKTDMLKGSIPLSFENPFSETKGLLWDEFQQRIFVGGPGTIGIVGDDLDDGGIEAVDPATMQSSGMVITGADIHASILDYVIVGSTRAYAIIVDHDSNSVVELAIGSDPAKRKIVKVLLSSTSLITDIEMTETGELWVAYRGENDPSGLRIFDITDNHELTVTTDDPPKPKPISLGQAPFTLAFIE